MLLPLTSATVGLENVVPAYPVLSIPRGRTSQEVALTTQGAAYIPTGGNNCGVMLPPVGGTVRATASDPGGAQSHAPSTVRGWDPSPLSSLSSGRPQGQALPGEPPASCAIPGMSLCSVVPTSGRGRTSVKGK